jgi:hypothetical protein
MWKVLNITEQLLILIKKKKTDRHGKILVALGHIVMFIIIL